MGGQSGKAGTVFGKLPAIGFEEQVVLNVRPVECTLPILYVKVFVDPCDVIIDVMGKVEGAVVVESIGRVPISQ